MNNLENLKIHELRVIAKEQGIKLLPNLRKYEILKLIKEKAKPEENKQDISKQSVSNNKENKETEYIEIPKELKDLNLTPVKKKLTKEDVELNDLQHRQIDFKTHIPKHLLQEIEREDYTIIFPKNTPEDLQRQMDRGAEFIRDKDGTLVKFSAKQSNSKGELEYHVAMKIKKMIVGRENELKTEEYEEKVKRVQEGDINSIKNSFKLANDKYTTFLVDKNNKL